MSIEIIVPAPGESVSEVTISQWLVKVGDWVNMDDPIAEFESDKATFEVNAEKAGIILELKGSEGDTIEVNSVVAVIDDTAPAPAQSAEKVAAPKTTAEIKKEAPKADTSTVPAVAESKVVPSNIDIAASPIAKQLISEYAVNPASIVGTGSNGRITKIDVLEAIVKQGVSKAPGNTNGYGFGVAASREPRREKMSNLRKTVAKRLVAAKNDTAMLTTFNEVNMKPIMDLRNVYKDKFKEQYGINLGFMSFFTRAVCIALQEWPAVNASIEGEEIVYHDYCDISIAVSAPKGLVVPVIRNAEALTLDGIENEVKRLALKARDNKLSIDEMTGGTFTITNGGVFGSMMSTPILNPPQSGILGMHNIVERPVVENGAIVIRPMMYLALSYDHRIIDGRESVSFLVRVKTLLENPEMLLSGKRPEAALLGL
jgi:2-oxoglutarate dehydrogenase E2 component (dihydrolipoamide succinyltransferase)